MLFSYDHLYSPTNKYAKGGLLIENYRTIQKNGSSTLIIKKSRFIAQLYRIQNENQAQQFIEDTRQQHQKANHNCFAYQLNQPNLIQRMSDDGEPSGTAGSPILNVLTQENLQDVICIVTRYFGGIKLGAGGLIRAYGQATAQAIATVGIVQGISQISYQLSLSYKGFERLKYYLEQADIPIEPPTYSATVSLVIWLDEVSAESQLVAIQNLLSGQIEIKKLAHAFREIPLSR